MHEHAAVALGRRARVRAVDVQRVRVERQRREAEERGARQAHRVAERRLVAGCSPHIYIHIKHHVFTSVLPSPPPFSSKK